MILEITTVWHCVKLKLLTSADDVDSAGIPTLALSEQEEDRIVWQCSEIFAVFYLRSVRFEH